MEGEGGEGDFLDNLEMSSDYAPDLTTIVIEDTNACRHTHDNYNTNHQKTASPQVKYLALMNLITKACTLAHRCTTRTLVHGAKIHHFTA